jgi:hypothetical protein
MGDIAEEHAAMADFIEMNGMDAYGRTKSADAPSEPDDDFDVPDVLDQQGQSKPSGPAAQPVRTVDPVRPEAVRGRYRLPNPVTGKDRSWRRVSNYVKVVEDTYRLELWKQRNVLRGLALMIQSGKVTVDQIAAKHVKDDSKWLNSLSEACQDVAEAYKMADAGTALHKSTELADYAGGGLNRVPPEHRPHVRLYLDALAARGITIVPGMIERRTVSLKYDVAGSFDRIVRLQDGSMAIADLKTGDSLDFSMPGIAAQMDCYENGVNTHGVWDGRRYDDSIRVRDDFALIIHLPSTRLEVDLIKVDLSCGRRINATNGEIFETRKIKAPAIASPFLAADYGANAEVSDAYWLERLNASQTRDEMVLVAKTAKVFGQWNIRLANQARVIDEAHFRPMAGRMGS